MRNAIFLGFCFAIAGCRGDAGPPGSQGPQGPAGIQGQQGMPGKDAPGIKQPHLVLAATGEDLGISAGGTLAYTADGEHLVDYATVATVGFESSDCTGTGYVSIPSGMLENQFLIGPNATLLSIDVSRLGPSTDGKSFLGRTSDGKVLCQVYTTTLPRYTFTDTGISASPYSSTALRRVLM